NLSGKRAGAPGSASPRPVSRSARRHSPQALFQKNGGNDGELFLSQADGGAATFSPLIEKKMAQNIYDNPEFFAGYSQLPRQVDGLGGAPEWPAIKTMLPDLTAKRVVDLGCGFGWASRWFREQGAASVLGLD